MLHAAASVGAQDAKPVSSSNELTAEQQALIVEASKLSRDAAQLQGQGKLDEALKLAHRVVDLKRRVYGENNRVVADALSQLGSLYVSKVNYHRAEEQFRKALSIYERNGQPTSLMAYVLDSLTVLRWIPRDYEKAEDYGKRALELKAQLYGEKSLHFFKSIDNLLKVYESAEKTSALNALYARALAIVEETKDRIPDRLALFRYHCGLLKGKQTPEVVAMLRHIEALLAWNPASQTPMTFGVLNGRALNLVRPPYPDEARARHASGVVVVHVQIDECGNVTSAKAVSGDPSLKHVSELAAKAATFSPTFMRGTPVRVTGTISFNFIRGVP